MSLSWFYYDIFGFTILINRLSSFYYIVRQGYATRLFCSDIVVGTSVALRHHYAFPIWGGVMGDPQIPNP